jgi:NADH-ubiquinone oxidoreductase chain 1
VGVLIGVAFFTLLERKVMGYLHFRKGPTKVFLFGLFQPFSDVIKLFIKSVFHLGFWFRFFYFFSPLLGLFIMFFLGFLFSWGGELFGLRFSLICFFSVLRLGVYFLLFRGWGSGRKFSLIGAYRSLAQSVSYEVCLSLFCLTVAFYWGGYSMGGFFLDQVGFWFGFFFYPFLVGWLFLCLAEANRSPFDFSEGESELVSGFNVEYGGGVFSLIFVCEYGMSIILGLLTVCLFFGNSSFFFKVSFFCVFFVWVRCCFPRFRYDFLMFSSWGRFLPLSLGFLVFVGGRFFLWWFLFVAIFVLRLLTGFFFFCIFALWLLNVKSVQVSLNLVVYIYF